MQGGFVDGDGRLVVSGLALLHVPDIEENICEGGCHSVAEENVEALCPSAAGSLHPVGGAANVVEDRLVLV